MNEQTDKVVKGVTYERKGHLVGVTHNCVQCVAWEQEGSSLCSALIEPNCAHDFVFKVKDIPKHSRVNSSTASGVSPVPPVPLQKASEPSQGVKLDEGKTLYSLVPAYALEAVARNLTMGLQKYKEVDNWKKVPDAENRYLNALYRHLEAHRKGEIYDTDNIDPTTTHMSAVAVNSMFLLELMLNPSLKDTNGTS